MLYFNERKNCPACTSEKITIRYQISYSKQPIKKYLIDFYSPQGGIEFEYLKDQKYILCDCKSCGMIFQKNIPNLNLMERLYAKIYSSLTNSRLPSFFNWR